MRLHLSLLCATFCLFSIVVDSHLPSSPSWWFSTERHIQLCLFLSWCAEAASWRAVGSLRRGVFRRQHSSPQLSIAPDADALWWSAPKKTGSLFMTVCRTEASFMLLPRRQAAVAFIFFLRFSCPPAHLPKSNWGEWANLRQSCFLQQMQFHHALPHLRCLHFSARRKRDLTQCSSQFPCKFAGSALTLCIFYFFFWVGGGICGRSGAALCIIAATS